MIALKDITKLPELEILDGTEKVILNVDGNAYQASLELINPVEEWDLDFELISTYTEDSEGNGDMEFSYTINHINNFDNIKNKILNGVQPKCKVKETTTGWGNPNTSHRCTESINSMFAVYNPANNSAGAPEHIWFLGRGSSTSPYLVLLSDNTITEVGDDG